MITKSQLSLLHHTLGVTPERRDPYRNHFVAGVGHHDQPDLERLEVAGLMERAHAPKFLHDGDVVFRVTDAGLAYALEHLPQPPKRSRYEQYLHSETDCSFAEFIGINKPVVETEYQARGRARYRFARYDGHAWQRRLEVAGDWAETKKAAKGSYKAALKAAKGARQ